VLPGAGPAVPGAGAPPARRRRGLAAAVATLALTLLPAVAAGQRWPTRERYIAAMHNSRQFLRDPKLAGAVVELDRWRHPLVYSGSFSSVFKLRTASGRKLALRLFHPGEEVKERQSVTVLQQRYQLLGSHLARLRAANRLPPEIIDFALVPGGIEIRGEPLPILKLPWVEGRTLDDWIGRRLAQGRRRALEVLAGNWRAAMRDLRAVEIAWGDPHHRNVMIEPSGAMRFLDYDSMYVPALAGAPNSEIGHQNFQHPGYHFPATPRPFDLAMDHFPALVVYVSLLAIADRPDLWRKYHNEDNLIFVGDRDFVSPQSSPVFRDILETHDPTLRALARALAHHASAPPSQVPPLEQVIESAGTPWYQRR
jgi:hypothetical protein